MLNRLSAGRFSICSGRGSVAVSGVAEPKNTNLSAAFRLARRREERAILLRGGTHTRTRAQSAGQNVTSFTVLETKFCSFRFVCLEPVLMRHRVEPLENLRVPADENLMTERIAVPHFSIPPLANDAEPARMREEGIEAFENDEVQVQEQHHALEIGELRREQSDLGPALRRAFRRGGSAAAAAFRPPAGCPS